MVTVVTSTIGTGGDYTTLQAWEDAAPANLVTDDKVWRGECKNQTFSGSAVMLTMSGSTSDATRYKEITTEAGASFRDNASVQTNALRYNTANGAAITSSVGYSQTISANEAFCRVTGLQITNSVANSAVVRSNSADVTVNFCILETATSATSPDVIAFGAVRSKLLNSLIVKRAGTGRISDFFTSTTVVNCTFVAPSDKTKSSSAVRVAYPSGAVFKNCAFFGVTDIGTTTGTTYTTCLTDDATPPTGCTTIAYDTSTGSGFEATTDAARDFRIKTTSAMIAAGTVDATNAPIDIAGTTRGAANDVGCWEFVAAAGNVTGTFASTLAGVALAGTGSVTNEGAFASTLDGVSLAASGSVGAAPTGTFASTLSGVTLAAAGTITNVGSFATTLGGVTLAASGTVAPHVTGTFASTLAGVSLSASGFVGDPPVSSGFIQRRRQRPRIVPDTP
jgi:hypothetical protein